MLAVVAVVAAVVAAVAAVVAAVAAAAAAVETIGKSLRVVLILPRRVVTARGGETIAAVSALPIQFTVEFQFQTKSNQINKNQINKNQIMKFVKN